MRCADPVFAVDGAAEDAGRIAVAGQDLPEDRRIFVVLVQHPLVAGVPRQQCPIAMHHRDRGFRPEGDGREEALDIDGLETAGDDAEELAVGRGQLQRDDGDMRAGDPAHDRFDQQLRRCGIELQPLEITAIGDIDRRHRP